MKNCYYSKYEPIFGSWHITEELGSGAEGHLYRIMRRDSMGNVFYSALKAVSVPAHGDAEIESVMAAGMNEEEARKYFRDMLEHTAHEFGILARLKGNSNIVSYEDHEIIEKDDGFGWDILIRLEELTPLLKHAVYNPLPEDEVIRLGTDICKALVLCGRYGIIHRDIKPENIFISPAGSYKLGDFGIARIIEDTSPSLSRKGTISFMAPEIYWGKDYGRSADIYSLGLVLYQFMNDGRLPLMPVYPDPIGYTDRETAFARRMSGAEIPEPRNGSAGLKQVILKACSYDENLRYQNAEEMLRDLEAVSAGRSPQDEAGSHASPKRRWPLITGIALAVCLAAALIIWKAIPDNVEDIVVAGLDDGDEIYMEQDVKPAYEVRPDWFKDEPVTFTSSDTDVLTVDESGGIHTLVPGEADLVLSAKDYSETVHVIVVPKITSIDGIEKSIQMTTGDELTLKPELKPEKFSDEKVNYSVNNKKVAKVSGEGVVTAIAAGTAELTVTAGGSSIKSEITISDPVVYVPPAYTGSSGSGTSGSTSKKKSGKASKGYFDSSDDEHF